MFFANNDRGELRRRYISAWQRRRAGAVLEPLDAQIADVVALHPEYQSLLESAAGDVEQAYTVEQGQTNPFLHMGLHLAIREQLATRRPAGIEAVHLRLTRVSGDAHIAEHRMIEVLAETLWEAQRAGRAPDEQSYLERLQRL
jgi:Domain of unknown function (DUF1841)